MRVEWTKYRMEGRGWSSRAWLTKETQIGIPTKTIVKSTVDVV